MCSGRRTCVCSGAFLSDVQQTLINTQLHVEKSIKFAKVKFSDWDPKTDRKSIKKMENRSFFDHSQRISP